MPFQEGVPQRDSIQVIGRLLQLALRGSHQIIGQIIISKQSIWDLIERVGYKLFQHLYLVEQERRFSSGREERGHPVNLARALSNQNHMRRWREKIGRVVREKMKYTSPFQINKEHSWKERKLKQRQESYNMHQPWEGRARRRQRQRQWQRQRQRHEEGRVGGGELQYASALRRRS